VSVNREVLRKLGKPGRKHEVFQFTMSEGASRGTASQVKKNQFEQVGAKKACSRVK